MSRRRLTVMSVVVSLACGVLVGVLSPGWGLLVAVLGTPILLVVGVRSPAWVLVAYLFAGAFKEFIPTPVDLTVLLAVVVIALVVLEVAENGMPHVGAPFVLFVSLTLIVLVGLVGPGATDYGVTKATRFATLGLVSFVGAYVLIRDEERTLSFVSATIAIGTVMSLYAVASGGAPELYGRYTAFGSNTIALGRASAFAFIGVVAHVLWRRSAVWWGIPTALVAVAALAGSGSRGPAMGLVVAVGLLVSYRMWTRRARRRTIMATIVLTIAGLAATWRYIPEASLSRVSGLLQGDPGASVLTRLDLLGHAINLWQRNPWFGVGTGSFATIGGGYVYPHNMLLELGAENGILGLSIMLVLLGMGAIRVVRAVIECSGVSTDFIFGALVVALVNAMVSGDLNDNRFLYALVAIGVVRGAEAIRRRRRAGDAA